MRLSDKILKGKLDSYNYRKLKALGNLYLEKITAEVIDICQPRSVFVRTDAPQDALYIRKKAIANREEAYLKTKGHTVHFDGFYDQARDKKNTKYLVSSTRSTPSYLNCIDKRKGLSELRTLMQGIMRDKEMFVCFFCLGPKDSMFSIPALQITDSAYVAHSEDILYRPGYEFFKRHAGGGNFFRFIHSAGELENAVSKNVDKRRVYIDLDSNTVYSLNTQYAGNTVGLKKPALRLAINKAAQEGWLTEHMFLMGVYGKGRKKTYFCGAFPSACGKTSTSMLKGERIVGDDITYLRKFKGKAYGANVERGIFGIIQGIDSKDNPLLYGALHREGEIIFSNVLVYRGRPYWVGKDRKIPAEGINFSGEWFEGKKDTQGNLIPPSHKNARFTLRLKYLSNVDKNLESPQGVEIGGFIYGGRDSDTSVPVEEAFSWQHGIITKAASLESETTAATLGKEGVRVFNPMSILDFLSIPLFKYIKNNLDFAKGLKRVPKIFSVNYFLKSKDGSYLNDVSDKHVWLKWMEKRVHNQAGALVSPTGLIPIYDDLKLLFRSVLKKNYAYEDYEKQFTIRVKENLDKMERIWAIYQKEKSIPKVLFKELNAQRKRLENYRKKFGDYISPSYLKLA